VPVEIKLNLPERIRRAKAAKPMLTDEQLAEKFECSLSQVKAALAYREPGQKARKRA
jgi:uncharacterized protein (DUF433 family)